MCPARGSATSEQVHPEEDQVHQPDESQGSVGDVSVPWRDGKAKVKEDEGDADEGTEEGEEEEIEGEESRSESTRTKRRLRTGVNELSGLVRGGGRRGRTYALYRCTSSGGPYMHHSHY